MNTLKIKHKNDFAIIEIDNGKVNAIDINLARELGEAFELLDKDEKVKGVVLSGKANCFSAGVDIVSVAEGGQEGMRQFLSAFLDAVQKMVRFSKPFVCAITGYAPAGATMITLCADYRVMGKGEKHVVGMHEFKMSLQITEMLCEMFAYHLGEKVAWKAVQEGRLFNSDEALAIGLVDESVEVENVLERSEQHLKKLMAVHPPVFKKSKTYFRKGLLEIVDKPLKPMVDTAVKDLNDTQFEKMINVFLKNLKK